MNLEAFDQMMCKIDASECVKFFHDLSEKDRKLYCERAQLWHDVAMAFAAEPGLNSWIGLPDSMSKREKAQFEFLQKVKRGEIPVPSEARSTRSLLVSRLAITACAGLSDIRKIVFPSPLHAALIIRNRKPKWIDRWVNFACESEPQMFWDLARGFEADAVPVERGDGYWLSMALTLGSKDTDEIDAILHADRDLTDDLLWQMLDNQQAVRLLSDPTGMNWQNRSTAGNFASGDWRSMGRRFEDTRRASYNWKLILGEMAAVNEIDQNKLSDKIFNWLLRLSSDAESKASSGLGAELSPAGWFQSLFDEMKLTPAAKGELSTNFIALLSVKDSSTLAWALQQLLDSSLSDRSMEDLLCNIPRVFFHKRKEPALLALKLLEQFHKQDLLTAQRIALVVLDAFEHPSGEIHKRALSFLKKIKMIDDPVIMARLASLTDRLGGLLRKEVIDKVASLETVEVEGSDSELGSNSVHEDLLQQAASCSGIYVELAGLPAACAALSDTSKLPDALELISLDIPRLDPSKKISPIENLDDLILLYLHVLEKPSDIDDVERLIQGVLYLCDQRPDDFENRVSSLRKKVKAFTELPNQSFFTGWSAQIDLQVFAICWLDSTPESSHGIVKGIFKSLGFDTSIPGLPAIIAAGLNTVTNNAAPLSFLAERLKAISKLLPKRKALPLLSPTHKGGWIDPRVIPLRISSWEKAKIPLEKTDVIQMILRLAPEYRQEALRKMPISNDENIRAIRWALGDEMKTPIENPELWVAAFRCRDPRGSSHFLKERFPDLGPDSAIKATYIPRHMEYRDKPDGVSGAWQRKTQSLYPLEVVPAFKYRNGVRLFPTELLHDLSINFESSNLIEGYFLLDRDAYFAHMMRHTALYLDSQGTYWQNSWNPLFDPDVSLSGPASWLLAFALSAKQPEAARLALDGLISGIEECRIDGTAFGLVLGKVFSTDKITVSRWIFAFNEIARISPLHLHFMVTAIESCIAQIPDYHASKPPIPLLELLYESCLSSGSFIANDSTRKFLEKIEGKGKAAKLAKTLLELAPGKDQKHRKAVACQMLESRIQRARRWSECKNDASELSLYAETLFAQPS